MNLKPDLSNLLQKHFGFNSFREKQFDIIESLVSGNDTLVIMPTGGGKSLCYQISALYLKGVAIIISPLIALMKNQVDVLNALFEKKNIASVYNSSLSQTEKKNVIENIINGDTKFVYIVTLASGNFLFARSIRLLDPLILGSPKSMSP